MDYVRRQPLMKEYVRVSALFLGDGRQPNGLMTGVAAESRPRQQPSTRSICSSLFPDGTIVAGQSLRDNR